ncbi:MAG TPA: sulfatase-like hydrolase/transferase, partial [Bacteroidales bacterium]|nr:sulfatase-like hydrolase/transferase [Bacteroidales bacterium]
LLREHGYNTAMVGKWHLQMDFAGTRGKDRDWSELFTEGPTDHGFDYFFGIPASMNYGVLTYLENDRVLDPPVLWTKKKDNPNPRSFNRAVSPFDYRMTPPFKEEPGEGRGWIEAAPSFNDELVLETFADKAVSYINQVAPDAKNGKPFFLYFAMTSPHLPHCTHPDFQGRTNCGNYGDFMEETDFRIGQVLKALEENGLEDNTLVIFSSDNGAETNYAYWREKYDHWSCMNFKGGKRDIYEGGHHVPFLMCWPGVIKAGSRVDVPVCQSDFLATIADIIGTELPDNAGEDSYSLMPLISENAQGEYRSERAVIHHSVSGHFAIRKGKWKLNLFRGSGGSLKPKFIIPGEGEAPFELYNMEIDQGETANLYFEYPEIVEELKSEFIKIIKSGRSTPGTPQDFVKDNWEQINWVFKTDVDKKTNL